MSDLKVVKLEDHGLIRYDQQPPDEVLEKAKAWGLDRVLILGLTHRGGFKYGGSFSELATMSVLLDMAKRDVMNQIDAGIEDDE